MGPTVPLKHKPDKTVAKMTNAVEQDHWPGRIVHAYVMP